MLFKAHTGPKIRPTTPWTVAGELPSDSYRQLSEDELELIYWRARSESGNRVCKEETEPVTWRQYAYVALMLLIGGLVLFTVVL